MHRQTLASAVGLTVLSCTLALTTVPAHSATPRQAAPSAGAPGAQTATDENYLVGRAVADITGEVAEVGFIGYAMPDQTGQGLATRQYSRAFVIADPSSGERIVHVTADIGMVNQSVRDGVLAQLAERFGTRYGERNVMITATHTHAGPGGIAHHGLYNITTLGHHPKTFSAAVDGIVKSIVASDGDLAPASLSLGTSQLSDASANRSRQAFDRNPASDRAHFPTATDTTSTTLSVRRGGELDSMLNWFGVHATSLTNKQRLVSADNRGYSAHKAEHLDHGVDLLSGRRPEFVAAFAQTAAGDMSPNLNLRPGDGPTTDEFTNTRILGTRIEAAATDATESSQRPLAGGVDSRLIYVDLSRQVVQGRFTPDGEEHRTCSATFGASFAAGSTEDGPGVDFIKEGKDGGNPVLAGVSEALYTVDPELKACQAPKEVLLDVGSLDLVQQVLPVQLMRIGDQYLLGVPGEVTVVAGLRLRRTVAKALGTDLAHVTLQGYANAYAHYVTTPEEYDSKEYEGASTLFGRYELPAFQQVADGLARDMADGLTRPIGAKERDRSHEQFISPAGVPVADAPFLGKKFGDVLTAPSTTYAPGDQVSVAFSGAHPNNNLKHGGTYLAVERKVGPDWVRVADDNDWSTRFTWQRVGISASRVRITWDIEKDTPPGEYRIRYFGDAKAFLGPVRPIAGTSGTFAVSG